MLLKFNKPALRDKLLDYGYTVAELQRRANVSSYTMYKALNHDGAMRVSTVKKIADALGCKVKEIAVIDEPSEPTEKGA